MTSIYDELERLEKGPWLKTSILRLAGTFSDKQRQAAAACDLYNLCMTQSQNPDFFAPSLGGVPDRFYPRLQIASLHCW